MWQPAHGGEQSDVTTLHSEHRSITNTSTRAGGTDQCPRVWVCSGSTFLVIPYHCALLFKNTHTVSASEKLIHLLKLGVGLLVAKF